MPLLIPGLTEVAAKKMSKRLHKALSQHPGTPSLTQLQTLLAQAAGHADWYAAQKFWTHSLPTPGLSDFPAKQGGPGEREHRFKEHVNEQMAGHTIEVHLPKAWSYWQKALSLLEPPPALFQSLSEHFAALEMACGLVDLETPQLMCSRLSDLAFKAQRPSVFYTAKDILSRMQPLMERLEYAVQPWPATQLAPPPKPPSAWRLLREHATLIGDKRLLEHAIEQACTLDPHDHLTDQEGSPALEALCSWWNTQAPAPLRTAGCFQVHVFDPTLEALVCLGEPEMPPVLVDDFVRAGKYALFKFPQGLVVAVLFMKGKAHNRYENGTSLVFATDGSLLFDIGCPPEEFNPSFSAIRGLQLLAEQDTQKNRDQPLSATSAGDKQSPKDPNLTRKDQEDQEIARRQVAWEAEEAPDGDESLLKEFNPTLEDQVVQEIARRQVEAVMPRVLCDLEYSYDAANRAMGSMESLRNGLDSLVGPAASMNAHTARDLVHRLQDLVQAADNPQVFEDPTEALDRMKILVLQLEKRFEMLFRSLPSKRPATTLTN